MAEVNRTHKTREYSNKIGLSNGGRVPGADNPASFSDNVGKDLPRNFDERGLRKNTPFPNIIRIEQLDGTARKRYSSGFINAIDTLHSVAEKGRIGGIQDEVFYGFMKTPPDSQRIRIGWQRRGGVGEVLNTITGMAAGVSGIIGSADPTGVGKTAAMKATEMATNLGKGASALINGTGELMSTLAGINSGIVGQNTIKRVKDISMESFQVVCSWYLPEQYALYCKGIRSLFRMAYPNEVDLGDACTKDLAQTLMIGLDLDDKDATGAEVDDAASDQFWNQTWKGEKGGLKTLGGMFAAGSNLLVRGATSAVSEVIDIGQLIATKFGATFSIDPNPVRVSLGQSWDLEPLVITSLSIKPSKETFIEPTTHAHLPITIDITIGLDYWLTPRAGQENMSIAGQEIFGWLQEERYKDVIKNTEKYVNEKNKNMWDLLKPENLNSASNNRRGMNM